VTILPRIVVTGASGFIGRHLLDTLKENFQVIAMARRSQARCGAPVHSNISWFQVDIGDREPLAAVFRMVAEGGGADVIIHFAAHYDFTGEEHPEYWRTNVNGLRNVLEECRNTLHPKHFIFASSVAACAYPPPGRTLTEASPPDGEHLYSITKRIGEEMLREYRNDFHSVIVRFAALFSDWCEYAPLFFFLGTWLSPAWNARLLGGKGLSAVPYLHVREVPRFFGALLGKVDQLTPCEVVIASPDGAVNHVELFEAATLSYFGYRRRPFLMPRLLCGPGMWVRDAAGRLAGNRPFERPWMARYIDLSLAVDGSRTRQRLGWSPVPRLHIVRRMPFLIENFKTDPLEWNQRNQAALKTVRVRSFLRLHALLEHHEGVIRELFTERLLGRAGREMFPSYQQFSIDEHQWHHRLILQRLMDAVRTREKAVFMTYCRDLAERRIQQGFLEAEVCAALETLNEVCLEVLGRDPEARGLQQAMHDYITTTIQFGVDQIQEIYEVGPSAPRSEDTDDPLPGRNDHQVKS
jgi:nucleoside-diphosphate-sugar epimerase